MTTETPWPRAIILVDMNAFFASIEQLDRPSWRGHPVAVTNGRSGTCIITCSYEARAHGIHTGMRLREARRLCPQLIQAPSRPQRYSEVSTRIMAALQDITPDVEVFSVDEAFLDVTHCQALLGHPAHIARLTRDRVYAASQLPCSIGVSGDKTTAKYAAKLHKPNGLTVIPPWEAAARLADVPVTELCGIAAGIGRFLAAHGVHVCGDMARLPIGVLARRYGNPGRRIWYMCQGRDPAPVSNRVAAPKSIGHGKVIPPDTRERAVLHTYLLHMAEKVAARLRRHGLESGCFLIAVKGAQGWLGGKYRTLPTRSARDIMRLCHTMLDQAWHGEGVHQVQITALAVAPAARQLDLFNENPPAGSNDVVDDINNRYGEFTLAPARLLRRSDMPNVISPSWRPNGHRNTV